MVTVKSSMAMGSFLGRGTHVWIEVVTENGEKFTFSGAKAGKLLGVIKNFKKDYNKPSSRGTVVLPPPEGMSQTEWDERVLEAGEEVISQLHRKLRYSGLFPYFGLRGNCGTAVKRIIEQAGGALPKLRIKGFTPSL